MRQAVFKLSRVLQDKSDLHYTLHGGKDASPRTIELTADIPSYFKLECPNGALSPIVMSLNNLAHPSGIVKNLIVFGSFKEKEPSSTNKSLHVINPQRIYIKEPRGKKKFRNICTVKEKEENQKDAGPSPMSPMNKSKEKP